MQLRERNLVRIKKLFDKLPQGRRVELLNTSFGAMLAVFWEEKLCALTLPLSESEVAKMQLLTSSLSFPSAVALKLAGDMEIYLQGRKINFSYPLLWDIYKPFTRKVLKETCKIPYGRTITYKKLAENINNSGSFRAIGQALAKNYTPILIPCHRVVGSKGSLKGYSWGEEWKRSLLILEGAF